MPLRVASSDGLDGTVFDLDDGGEPLGDGRWLERCEDVSKALLVRNLVERTGGVSFQTGGEWSPAPNRDCRYSIAACHGEEGFALGSLDQYGVEDDGVRVGGDCLARPRTLARALRADHEV